jgi:hypothetical protein
MSRFTLCNCLAGFSAAPEWHATDCPGRFGAGKPSAAVVKPTILKDTNVGYAASSGATVPPAGDVEVLAWRVAVEGHSTKYHEHAVLVEDALKHHARFGRAVEVVELIDRIHVTRLTADLHLASLARDAHNDELTHQKNLCIEAQDYAENLQSELTKARELIERGDLAGAFGRFPDLSTDVKQYLAPKSVPATPGKTLREELGVSVEEWADFKEWLKAKETAKLCQCVLEPGNPRVITQGGHSAACTRCNLKLKPAMKDGE